MLFIGYFPLDGSRQVLSSSEVLLFFYFLESSLKAIHGPEWQGFEVLEFRGIEP